MAFTAPRVSYEYAIPGSTHRGPANHGVDALLHTCRRGRATAQHAGHRRAPRRRDHRRGRACFPRLDGALTILHVTDGAPRHRRQWGRQEYATWDDYARQRLHEVECALRVAGVDPSVCRRMEVMDSEVSLNMVPVTRRLMEIFDDLRPEVVITHPYEGGHTDHDATAFAVRAACTLLARDGAPAPASPSSPRTTTRAAKRW